MKNPRKKAAVIGSGFGGLAVAIRLQAAGYQTTIFEKRDQPGGRAYVYQDQGFKFDAGPTVITAPECIEELYTISGRKMSDYIELKSVMPFYRLLWEDGTVFDYSNQDQELERQIKQLSPDDWGRYLEFLKYSKEVFDEGYTKLAHVPFQSFWSMIKVSPELIRLKAYQSVYTVVSKYIKNEKLRQAFSFHSLLVGGNPFKTSSIYTLIHYLERNWGVYFPVGGTGALVHALVRLFKDLGGEIQLNAEVERILSRGAHVMGVKLKNTVATSFDLVVSNADVAHTYNKLLSTEPKAQNGREHAMGSTYSMSLFLIYFGTDKKYENLAHHNVIFGPRYKELLEDIFKNGVLADDFSLYLHMPTLTDSSLAPEGKHAFYVLSPVPHLGKANIDWKKMGPEYADKILSYLEKHYMPDLKKHIVTSRIFTPQDFKTELNSHLGSAFSLEPTLTQSAYFRTHNRDDEIHGLYFVGAGTHPGAGVPGVINSAKSAFSLIVEDFGPQARNPNLDKKEKPTLSKSQSEPSEVQL